MVVVFIADRFLKNIFWFTPPRGAAGHFLHPTLNREIAFSLSIPFVNDTALLAVLSVVSITLICFAVYTYMRQSPDRIAWGLIAAGAVSNVMDRYVLGGVLDYIDLKIWPVFNLADASIVCGVGLLLLREYRSRRAHMSS